MIDGGTVRRKDGNDIIATNFSISICVACKKSAVGKLNNVKKEPSDIAVVVWISMPSTEIVIRLDGEKFVPSRLTTL
jgi:hypothetical protein